MPPAIMLFNRQLNRTSEVLKPLIDNACMNRMTFPRKRESGKWRRLWIPGLCHAKAGMTFLIAGLMVKLAERIKNDEG